ncbi:Galactosylgalactosylxylosylprotein 3-beta-glucuronosyltransferase [Aphelenchoides besseyi]|nr:Galactosylgalactosylxylosylprotein 3-beta-glucuronosyltransferase [Aphelenchoides besseyi]
MLRTSGKMNDQMLPKILIALGLFMFFQMIVFWGRLAEMGDDKMTLEAQVDTLKRKKDSLDHKIRDLLPLTKNRLHLPMIFFITPTKRRPAQKADLIRLYQTLSYVPNLYWIVVEDAEQPSSAIDEILARTRLKSVHLSALTPPQKRLRDKDPNWRLPRGVIQRNTALKWIRSNFGTLHNGVVFFGDDDNVYDWRLFEQIRSVSKIGVWPVGLVGGLLVETPLLTNGNIVGFSSIWKKERPFPIDMAAFAVNLTIVNEHPEAEFSYDVPRGYQQQATWVNGKVCFLVLLSNNSILGQNFYYPPDFNYKVHGNLNRYHGTHALRERAKKIKDGIIVIRFEMPFNNFDYELVDGLARQEIRFDPADVDNLPAVDRNFAQKLAGDAMFKAEHVRDDKTKSQSADGQIMEKKHLNEIRASDSEMQKRLSFETVPLLPSKNEDKTMAQRMLRLKDVKTLEERQKEVRDRLTKESIFKPRSSSANSKARLKIYATKEPSTSSSSLLHSQSLVKKRPSTSTESKPTEIPTVLSSLVDYESDDSST